MLGVSSFYFGEKLDDVEDEELKKKFLDERKKLVSSDDQDGDRDGTLSKSAVKK